MRGVAPVGAKPKSRRSQTQSPEHREGGVPPPPVQGIFKAAVERCPPESKGLPQGFQRVIIEGVSPEIDSGRFPIKRVVGETVEVQAFVFGDGHDVIRARLKYRHETASDCQYVDLEPQVEDRWTGSFPVSAPGFYFYTVEGWVDPFATWLRDLQKKATAGQDLHVELLSGAELVQTAARSAAQNAAELQHMADVLRSDRPAEARLPVTQDKRLAALMELYGERSVAQYQRELRVWVDPPLARFSAWYEMFPRSAGRPGQHGTFKDVEAQLPRIANMGFDILYLPPIHPIGKSFRKGKNGKVLAGEDQGSTESRPTDVPGSPWAIGSEEGGHKSVHPQLGTLEDFRSLVQRAIEHKIEIALDIAFQCSPDHPYVKEHPEWFRIRPDGSIQYAENPPKKYQDIYPFNFECDDWKALWLELKSIFEFWMDQGVRIFRVDNPHTKPLPFWEWCIGELKRARTDVIFLSEAFTRRKVMYYLAKAGFSQSYNYFPWRNTKYELTQYLNELTHSDIREFFHASLWVNTPDILTQYLQYGGRPAFIARLVLAATLGASYGVYGPPFELCINEGREFGSEEYLNSEKYEIRQWDLKSPGSLEGLIARVNRIRRENLPLQSDWSLEFHDVDNEQVIAYSKSDQNHDNIIVTVVSLDPHHVHSGWLRIPLERWGLSRTATYQVHDLLTDARYLWTGERNYVELNPRLVPAHIFRLRRYVRTERDFDYYM